MRARSLKPAFFKNELLATSDPLYAWVFGGLWCLADREGRLEDRPRRIHLEINAGRAYEGTAGALSWLAENGFILRYEAEGTPYVQVLAFKKHQTPHQNEKSSTLPAPVLVPRQEGLRPMDEVLSSKEGSACDQIPKHFALTPSSLTPSSLTPSSLTPSSLTPDSGPGSSDSSKTQNPHNPLLADSPPKKVSRKTCREDPEWMLAFKLAYPPRSGDPNWRGALRAAHARITEGHTPQEFIAAAQRYAKHCQAAGKMGTEFVQQASRFLGPGKPFLVTWDAPPPKVENLTQQMQRRLAESIEKRAQETGEAFVDPFAHLFQI